ncbi:hypothetical protein DFH07DRAFT_1062688 [Mycena maculata]|uniref:Uncharacterized protein n=1 Tax=Mycena maculata TaxID=230809 RepID=A0AAD7N7F1_9AGAR|nr:hypothetical protein DFH07DRAFT_1062688 [Mycena maculata]
MSTSLWANLFGHCQPAPSHDDTAPTPSIVPLTVYSVFQTLEEAVTALTPSLSDDRDFRWRRRYRERRAPALAAHGRAEHCDFLARYTVPGDAGAANQDIATLVESDLKTALNGLVTELGLDSLLTPVDTALSGLLTGLNAILPGVLAIVGGVQAFGDVVGGLLSGFGTSDL